MPQPERNTHRIDASELVGVMGFSCMFCWIILSFFWLFPHATYGINAIEGRFLQSLIYLGLPLGYLLQHVAVRASGHKQVNNITLTTGALIGFAEPAMCVAYSYGIDTPLPVVGVANLLTGIAASFFIIAWLDACTRAKWENAGMFSAYSLLGGSILAACAALSGQPAASIIAVLCIVASSLLAHYIYFSFAPDAPGAFPVEESGQAAGPQESASAGGAGHVQDAQSAAAGVELQGQKRGSSAGAQGPGEVENLWGNPLEIEPSFFVFGMSFGFAFQQLVAQGSFPLLIGLAFGLLGSLTIAVLATRRTRINITVLQRTIVCVVVLYCVSLQFVPVAANVVLTGIVIGAWAALVCSNYALIIDKCELESSAFCEQAPVRLIIRAAGFACGWLLAAGLATAFGDGSRSFAIAGVCIALVAVVVVMLFYPQKEHHISYEEERPKRQRVVFVRDSDAPTKRGLFERRCDAVSKLYGLSPRESEVLRYLARGRNGAYIEKELCISQNTVKTHVRKVYNKLDIHSQQHLMDFIESYPIED